MPYRPGVYNQSGMFIGKGISDFGNQIGEGMRDFGKAREDTKRQRKLAEGFGMDPAQAETMSLGELTGWNDSRAAKRTEQLVKLEMQNRKMQNQQMRDEAEVRRRNRTALMQAANPGAAPFNERTRGMSRGDRYLAGGGSDAGMLRALQSEGGDGFTSEQIGKARPIPGMPGAKFVPTSRGGGQIVQVPGPGVDEPKVGESRVIEGMRGARAVYTGKDAQGNLKWQVVTERAGNMPSMMEMMMAERMEMVPEGSVRQMMQGASQGGSARPAGQAGQGAPAGAGGETFDFWSGM